MTASTRAHIRRDGTEATETTLYSESEPEPRTSLVDRPLRNLKHGDAFAVLDSFGDIGAVPGTAEGLYYFDTRFLSRLELKIEGKRPLLLTSVVHEDKAALSVDLTNPDLTVGDEALPRDMIFIERTKFLWMGCSYERINVKNYSLVRQCFRIDILFDADFMDMFEVRGTRRPRRGSQSATVIAADRVGFRYDGLDAVDRQTLVRFSPAPAAIGEHRATFRLDLQPAAQTSIFVTVSCNLDEQRDEREFFHAYRDARRARRTSTSEIATVTSSNDLFDQVLCRATSDVYTLLTRTNLGPYPYAGIPWYNTIFGRDGIVTAMMMLWMDPSVARGVLRTLAASQATGIDAKSDAQPGKILHEMRNGEMANIGEIPFRRYYGTVDATPLFVMLAGMYLDRTGDEEAIREIWLNIEAALHWMDEYGDKDGDGFVEYGRELESGLANQGWKDSHDSIFHADGTGAEGPIALCEVQGYVFAAKLAAARMAGTLGLAELSSRLLREAEELRIRFEAAFWCEDIGTYALALDGAKRPCRVRASNAGHALFAGIAAPDRAQRVAASLLTPDNFSGWGIRTLARGEPRYNPMSYHNGSVWPHDNAVIALGFARYGLKSEASRVFHGLFDAATHQELSRLPELFCGFIRRPHRGPTPYPVACSPQAWAATATFGLLSACLGLELAHQQDEIRFRDPVMPDFLQEVVIRNLQLGTSRVDLRLHRYGDDVTANVLAREGSSRVLLFK